MSTSDIIKKAMEQAAAIRERAQKKLESRKHSPEEIAARKQAQIERAEAKRIIAAARAEANQLLGIEENPALDAYMASADARFAVGLVRAKRPADGTSGARYWDAALAAAEVVGMTQNDLATNGWNKKVSEIVVQYDGCEDLKRAQQASVIAKKVINANAEGYMLGDGTLTEAGEGIVKAHKMRVEQLKKAVFENNDDDDFVEVDEDDDEM